MIHYFLPVYLLQEYPIIGIHPPEADQALWGGETVVKGYIESNFYLKKKVNFLYLETQKNEKNDGEH